MCALAHVFEHHGLATVALSSVRSFTEKTRPPRALHCQFPLGRPLGKPGDAAYQRRVLEAAFDLLKAPEGPVLVDLPEEIKDATERPLDVAVPDYEPGADPPPVAEAKALRDAYDRHLKRYGHTNVGRLADADGIPSLISSFVAIAGGTPFKEAGIPRNNPMEASKDLMSYYEEAAAGIIDEIPEARAAESWFFTRTETGKLLKQAQQALKDASNPVWYYLIPGTQQG